MTEYEECILLAKMATRQSLHNQVPIVQMNSDCKDSLISHSKAQVSLGCSLAFKLLTQDADLQAGVAEKASGIIGGITSIFAGII